MTRELELITVNEPRFTDAMTVGGSQGGYGRLLDVARADEDESNNIELLYKRIERSSR